MFFSKSAGHKIIAAPNTNDYVFNHNDLTIDSLEHSLDLSGTIPAGSFGVLMHLKLMCSAAGNIMYFRHPDDLDIIQHLVVYSNVVNYDSSASGLVFCRPDRIVTYRVTTGVTILTAVIHGWVLK